MPMEKTDTVLTFFTSLFVDDICLFNEMVCRHGSRKFCQGDPKI